ncbi:hypothetical protein GCM10007094_00610 [Pseudovibrio japonicus]|uniref:Methyltransferase FkbM domain-containing protein n=1 Tax=Pseudovibrio japonicus TaxID=366534 RepID=A0ABQ3DXI9_9HYPH|nr:hypothetical protein [Pseudovibrio japonicus]GHB17078.1 hypothetical protein GCM10007094_00610 [Pseudovibrio japonicus]
MARKKVLNYLIKPLGFTAFRSEEVGSKGFMIANILKYRERLIEAHLLEHEAIVRRGPFEGLKLATSGAWNDGDVLTKVIGSYEQELHPYIIKIVEAHPSAMLNIGASDGFYALGMKRLLPDTRVYAYDIDENSRDVLKACADANGVSVENLKDFSFSEMAAFEAYDSLAFIIDCEGCEVGVETIPSEVLGKSTFLIELHEFMIPGIEKRLSDFLSQTHEVTLIEEAPRNTKDYPETLQKPAIEGLILSCEFREGPMTWLYAQPMRQ